MVVVTSDDPKFTQTVFLNFCGGLTAKEPHLLKPITVKQNMTTAVKHAHSRLLSIVKKKTAVD